MPNWLKKKFDLEKRKPEWPQEKEKKNEKEREVPARSQEKEKTKDLCDQVLAAGGVRMTPDQQKAFFAAQQSLRSSRWQS